LGYQKNIVIAAIGQGDGRIDRMVRYA